MINVENLKENGIREEGFGKDEKITEILQLAQNLSSLRSPVLVCGESGVGKKTLCRYIHHKSSRKDKDLIFVDCDQNQEEVEKKILGHRQEETGKFSKGALEDGNGGSVVLCNIDALEDSLQKKLYKIILDLPDYDLDVRLMATTSKNLSKLMGVGRFQRSLFNFFSGGMIHVPSLRERKDDIFYIFKMFLQEECKKRGIVAPDIEQDVVHKMYHYYWSKNIEEIKMMVLSSLDRLNGDSIGLSSFVLGDKKSNSMNIDADEDGFKLMSLKDAERLLIKKALMHTSENRTQAAKILGVSIRTLRNKINEYRNEGSNYFINLR